MCGITGIFHLNNKKVDKNLLQKFTFSLVHRGPDGKGYYYNHDQDLGLGHTRLKILDVSELSSQPFSDLSKRYSITYNGEVYNYLELKNELKEIGYKFKTTGDTEVVLNSFIEWGEKCNLKFNGMWAYAIWDNKLKKLYMSRDRFGVKPVYYMLSNDTFYFASELKSFKHLERESPKIDYGKFSPMHKDFNREDTFLKNVFLLGPGHQLELTKKKNLVKKKWWRTIENRQIVSKNYNEQVEQFKEIFFDSCTIRSRSDVDISTSLSGGLDSSSIVCTLDFLKKNNKINTNKFHKSYVLNYSNEKTNYDFNIDSDTPYANEVLKNIKSIPNIINLDKEKIGLNEFINSTYHQEMISGDDGLGPFSIYKNMKKDNIKVSLDGHGPDELLGGYRNSAYTLYNLTPWNNLINKLSFLRLNYKINSTENFSKILLKKLIKKIFNNEVPIKREKKNYFYHYDEDPKYLEYDNIEDLDPFNQFLYNSFHHEAMQKVLLKFDKLSMANGIESRCPFLDWRLVTFLFSIPKESKIDKKFTKKILRDSMININPPLINNRISKKGFMGNFEWIIENYGEYINDIIQSKNFVDSNIFDGKKIFNDYVDKKKITIKELFPYIQAHILNDNFSS